MIDDFSVLICKCRNSSFKNGMFCKLLMYLAIKQIICPAVLMKYYCVSISIFLWNWFWSFMCKHVHRVIIFSSVMHILRDVSALKYQCNLFDQRTIWSTIFKTEEYQHILQQDSYTVLERLFCKALLGELT